MEKNSTYNFSITSALSFVPLVRALEKTVNEGRKGIGQWYKELLDRVY